MEKQRYEAPAVTRVGLEVKVAVLAACHSSFGQSSQYAPPMACGAVMTGCVHTNTTP